MANNKFKLEFTENFWSTFDNALNYVELKIKNPQARNALYIETINAIKKRLPIADSFTSTEIKSKSKTYYVYHIKINNFYIFYEIKNNIMEVQRFAYGGMNLMGFFNN